MVELTSLWLPIALTAGAIFFLSFLCWMVLPHHRKDYAPLADEDGVMKFLRDKGVAIGSYTFPHCAGPAQMKDPAWDAKRKAGPSGMLQIFPPNAWNMGPALAKWFVLLLVVGIFVAYVASHALAAGAEYLSVFRIVGTVTFLTFCIQPFSDAIWKCAPCRMVLAHVVDGILYALVTAGIFGWLWPAATSSMP
jgi:hypothetical protein